MTKYSARTKINAKETAKKYRKMGYIVSMYRKRKGLPYGISVKRK